MAPLRLFVFGPPRLERGDQPVDLGLRRALALLVYLAVSHQPQSRDALATLLWPDSDQREARANLRRTLHRLGQAIGDTILTTAAETVAIDPRADLWLDCATFQLLIETGDDPAAVALYGDDFLAGFSLPDSPAFDEWQFFERERLRQLLAQTLERLVSAMQARADWVAAAEYARRWVALDPLHEPAQRALLAAYAQAGQSAAALRQYQELARLLDTELGAEPEDTTRALFEAIRTRRFPAASAEPPPAAAPVAATAPAAVPEPARQPLALVAPLIGRERELAELRELLHDPAGPHLVTLVGPGGVGKTHLAHAVAAASAERFSAGAIVVALVEVSTPEGIAPTITAALGLTPGAGSALDLLQQALTGREMLLVLDNFEHLLAGAALVTTLLGSAPRLRVLVTSRQRLGISGEQIYPLGGLALPGNDTSDQVLAAPAAQLLLQRAHLVRPDLDPDPVEQAAIARICTMVQGVPLAITLAASWAELLSFSEIAAEMARSLDFLATEEQDVPERQRSVRAVFAESWRRLPASAQQVFARLTVFRGGFTREAAAAVAAADLATLRRLVNTSFLSVNPHAQRYEIHELLRQFAAETLAGDPAVAAAGRQHSRYYLALVNTLTPDLTGPQQQQALDILAVERDNLQQAWDVALEQHDLEPIAAATTGLWVISDLRSAHLEGEQLFARAITATRSAADQPRELQGMLLAAQGYFVARSHRLAEGRALMERGIAALQQARPADPQRIAFARIYMGFIARLQEDYATAERIAEDCLAVFAEHENRWGVIYSLLLMGLIGEYRGRPVLARRLLQTCLDRSRELGDQLAGATAATGLVRVLIEVGDYAPARRALDIACENAERLYDPLSRASVLHERALLAWIAGQHIDAAAAFEASGTAFTRISEVWAVGPGATARALAGALRGDPALLQQAVEHVTQAAQARFERRQVVRLLNLLAQLVAERGDVRQALTLQRTALQLAEKLAHDPAIASSACHLGALSIMQDEAGEDVPGLLRRSLELALRHQLAPTALEACLVAAQLHIKAGRPEQTGELLDLAAEHPASPALTREQARQLRAQLAGEHPGLVRAADPARPANWAATAYRLARSLGDDGARLRAPQTNLGVRLPPLIGRDYELAQLIGLLHAPTYRLLALLGPGGIGKTRLAQEAGLAALEAFPDGVFFVPLAPIGDPDDIVAVIAEQLNFRFGSNGEPRAQLLDYLRNRTLLLILDNFEHLLDGADLVAALLRAAPGVQILVTSRERLNLADELVYTLSGVEIPTGEADAQVMERGAMRLLLQQIRQVRPQFTPGPADLDALIRICRQVDGMPLALILAASWFDLLTPVEVADEIARNLDFLAAELRDLPPRQRSVRTVFEVSWQRLPPAAQQVFARVAVFRGGFSRRAAEQVAAADLRTLRKLLNSSFVAVDSDDVYHVHELLRQFGAERLAEMGAVDDLLDRHSRYYLMALAELEPDLKGRDQLTAFRRIEQSRENVRQAWDHALQQGNVALVAAALDTMFLFGEKRGRFVEYAELLQQARERFAPTPEHDPVLWQRLTTRLSILLSRSPREHQIPLADTEHCLTIARQSGDQAEEALAHLALGFYYARTENDYARALPPFEQAYRLHQVLNDRFFMTEDLARIGICYGYLGDTQAFYDCCREGYEIAEAAGDTIGMATAQANLTESMLHLGRYVDMLEYGTFEVAMAERLGLQNSINHALGYIALGHFLQGDLAAARRVATAAYTLSAEINNGIAMSGNLSVLSLQAGVTRDYALAVQFAEESLTQPLNLQGMVQTYWGLTIGNLGLEQYVPAAQSLQLALEAAARIPSPVARVWLLPLIAVLLAHQDHPQEATAMLALAYTHPNSPTGWLDQWQLLTSLRTKLEETLGPATFAAAWERGTQLDLADAVAMLDQVQAGQ